MTDTLKAILLSDDAAVDAIRLAVGDAYWNMVRAETIELTEVDQHELWQIATQGDPGNGTENLPMFYVSRKDMQGRNVAL